ncbi:prolipoprotein diacylglyceryl transferase [Actinobaculum suis]|uniref:Phosphatidylglycerol--prolipoprotein diacylglyceryl transferase n=1 Tax=Actinobaculum suis TaxID=1657 RepID=A0A1G7BWH0_9ACTO|nr:prolipoprotein diacylglyceryl transferase [Actinobaculum suis]MDY5153070.1 prolipoprotein diacylglyceryl transferase [Actinobaculum suis]SDE31397.1 prolipoprotein diacylglyceryl transferase [Actinobaculum suis]
MIPQSIPSPSGNTFLTLGPIEIKWYAICIVIGIIAAWFIADKRYRAKGGDSDKFTTIAFWAVIFGIIGGRLYHVITDWQLYFAPGKNPWAAFDIRAGGLGIWGAIALGACGAWIGARQEKVRLLPAGDALAPGLLIGQAIGRLGNWFNQELYGRPTDLPWGLEIDAAHMPPGMAPGTTFHPTFLYELLWCLVGAGVLVWLEKRFHLVAGQCFAAYIMVYTAGRLWIETLRIDPANTILGLRLNVWTAIGVFLLGLFLLIYLRRRYQNDPAVDSINLPGVTAATQLQPEAAGLEAATDTDPATDPGAATDTDPAADRGAATDTDPAADRDATTGPDATTDPESTTGPDTTTGEATVTNTDTEVTAARNETQK